MIDKSKREYFSHDYTARSDEKIKDLISVHGMSGYGIYWALVEDLYLNANAMRMSCDRIAHEMRCESEVIRSIIFDFKLFKVSKDEKYFFSESIKQRLKLRDEKSLKASKSANKRWEKQDANALPPHSDRNAKKKRKEKESKVNKSKVNNNTTAEGDFEKPILEKKEIFKNPFSEEFQTTAWSVWKQYRAETKKPIKSEVSEQQMILDLWEMSEGKEDSAKKIIEQSLKKGWQGLFKPTELKIINGNGKSTNPNQSAYDRIDAKTKAALGDWAN